MSAAERPDPQGIRRDEVTARNIAISVPYMCAINHDASLHQPLRPGLTPGASTKFAAVFSRDIGSFSELVATVVAL